MVEDYIENDPHAPGVGQLRQFDQVGARAEAGIDVEKILDAVSVVAVFVTALPEDRAEPDRGDAQFLKVGEFGNGPGDCAALVAPAAGLRPPVPAPRRTVGQS